MKQYKVLTLKDKFLPGGFDPDRLEVAVNELAAEGWIVKAMATARFMGFGPREEMVVLLERDR